MKQTLTKYEKDIVDMFFIEHNIDTFDVPTFNLVLSNCLPTWRTESLLNSKNPDKKSLAYVDYVKDLLRQQ